MAISIVTTDDERAFERLIVRYFIWKQSKLAEKAKQNFSKADDRTTILPLPNNNNNNTKNNNNHEIVEILDDDPIETTWLYDEETQKCKQVVDILRDENYEPYDDEDFNKSIPEILKQVTSITNKTTDKTAARKRMRTSTCIELLDDGPTYPQHCLRDEVELIVDLVQKANAEEIEQLRAHNERLNNQLLMYMQKRSKFVTLLDRQGKKITTLRSKNEQLSKNRPNEPRTTLHDVKWEKKFQTYADLVRQSGGPDKVPPLKSTDNSLCTWVANQRLAYSQKLPIMTQEKIDKLNSIGFIWSPWEHKFQKLAELYKIHGTNNDHLIRKEDFALREWMTVQREYYHNNKLSQKRVDKLNTIGFVWVRHIPFVTFEMRLEQCRKFKAKYGHLSIPFLTDPGEDGKEPSEEERSFRIWAQLMRNRYKRKTVDKVKNSKLSNENIQALTEVGFDWKLELLQQETHDVFEDRFVTRFEQLKKVVEVCGTCNDKKSIQTVYPVGHPLAEWCKTIRRQYHRLTRGEHSTLTPERVKMLLDIGFDFNPRRHYAVPKTKKYKKFKGMLLEDNEYREVQTNNVSEVFIHGTGTGTSTAEMNTDYGGYNPDHGRYNPDHGRFNPDHGRFNPDHGRFNPDPGQFY